MEKKKRIIFPILFSKPSDRELLERIRKIAEENRRSIGSQMKHICECWLNAIENEK